MIIYETLGFLVTIHILGVLILQVIVAVYGILLRHQVLEHRKILTNAGNFSSAKDRMG